MFYTKFYDKLHRKYNTILSLIKENKMSTCVCLCCVIVFVNGKNVKN